MQEARCGEARRLRDPFVQRPLARAIQKGTVVYTRTAATRARRGGVGALADLLAEPAKAAEQCLTSLRSGQAVALLVGYVLGG